MLLHPLPRGGKRKWGPLFRYIVGKYPVSLGDLLDRLSSGSIKMNHNFKISKGSRLHTTHAGSASE